MNETESAAVNSKKNKYALLAREARAHFENFIGHHFKFSDSSALHGGLTDSDAL